LLVNRSPTTNEQQITNNKVSYACDSDCIALVGGGGTGAVYCFQFIASAIAGVFGDADAYSATCGVDWDGDRGWSDH
jgi:hypothetical protein